MAYFQCMNIGSEGASVLEDLTDISLNNLTNGQILKYNTTTQKWENSNESGEIPDVQLFETLTYTEVKISSVVSPFTITNNTLTSVSSSMSNSETNILSTGTFDLTDINIIEVVVDSATFYQGGNWNGFFYVCDDDTNVRNNTYPSVAHKIMFSNTSTPLKYSLDVSQLNGQWFIGVCTGGHTNLVVSAVAIGSGLTGHVIIDKNNVDMSKRSGLQFTGNVTVTDDSTNDKTVVNIQGTSIDDTTASGSTTYSSNKTNTLLNGKVDKVAGKELSTNDYTDADKTKLEGIAEGAEVNVQSDWNQTNSAQDDYIKNKPSAEEQTVTDTFSTVNGGLLSECKVNLSPVQDLHGYDHPWVGGSRKNLLPMTVDNIKALNTGGTWNGNVYTRNGGTFTILTDADNNVIGIQINGTFTATTTLIVLSSNLQHSGTTTYKINGASQNTLIMLWNNSWVGIGGASYGQDIEKTMADGTYIRQCAIQVSADTIDNEIAYPMIRLATETDPTFEPYENKCPISAHTQAKLEQRGGKNKFDDSLFDTDVGETLIYVQFAVPNGKYVMSTPDFPIVNTITNVFFLAGKVTGGASSAYNGVYKGRPISITVTDGYYTVVYRSSNSTNHNNPKNFNWQIEEGSTATPYVPYNGYQITVNLGGTYYSGTLDVVSGVLTVDKVGKDITTLANFRYSSPYGAFIGDFSDSKIGSMDFSSSAYGVGYIITNASDCLAAPDGKIYRQSNNAQFFIKDARFTDVTSFVSALSGQTLCYELATPTPIQLSPTMVKALVGENHLSAPLDGQEITESKYRELFTWDEVESLAQRIATSAVADLRCYQFQDGAYGILAYVDSGTVFYDWVAASPSVKLLSTISVMPPLDEIEFTDSSIYSSSICELIVVGDSDVPVVTHVKVTSGKVVFTLSEALDSTIRCACKVTNSILY